MEFAIIFFIVAVGLLVLIPVIGLVIQSIRSRRMKKNRKSSTYQKSDENNIDH